MPLRFASHLATAIREQRFQVTEVWVARLEEELGENAAGLPRLDLLDQIPTFLDRVADYVSHPDAAMDDLDIVESLGRLADLRRRLGASVEELLDEYRLLAEEVDAVIQRAASGYDGHIALGNVVACTGRFRDAMQLLSSVTGGAYRAWSDRYERERQSLFDTFGPLIEHELGNRLGAAETAVQVLQAGLPMDDEKRDRLYDLILDSIRGGRQTISDVGVLAQPLSAENEAMTIGLPLVVKESIRMAQATSAGAGIAISLTSAIPRVRVPGPPLRLGLANLIGNAVKYHRDEGTDRWVRISVELDEFDGIVAVAVEDNGPGISEDTRARIFDYRYRGNVKEEGSGLGLAITRDALARVGGSIAVDVGGEGGARFVIRVPIDGDPDGEEEEE